MDLKTWLYEFSDIYNQAVALLKEAGFDRDDGRFHNLCWDEDDADSFVPLRALEQLAPALYKGQEDLTMAMSRPYSHYYRLYRLSNGMFGYRREDGRTQKMWWGRHVEALRDVGDHQYWVSSFIDYESDYFLHFDRTPLDGLLIREPREKRAAIRSNV